jgi:spermidine synthase
MDWYREVYRDRSSYGLRVRERLFDGRSDLQRVEVIDTLAWGRVLVIDGIFMTSERDEHYYHELLVHPALVSAPSVARVLIIGGGDGGTAREVLRHPDVDRCLLVEIDPLVVETSRRFLPTIGTAWDDRRLEVRIGDGVAHVHETDERYDVVILDGTDPVGPGEGLFDERFYRGVARVLAPGGVLAAQTESPILTEELFFDIQATLRRVFRRVHPCFGPVPLYSAGLWSYTLAGAEVDPARIDTKRLAAIEPSCKHYSAEIHRAAFAMPAAVRRRLPVPDLPTR